MARRLNARRGSTGEIPHEQPGAAPRKETIPRVKSRTSGTPNLTFPSRST